VEELEESLVGKQLALDKVIKENEKLKTLIHHVDHNEVHSYGKPWLSDIVLFQFM
jgi:hypothetical protein